MCLRTSRGSAVITYNLTIYPDQRLIVFLRVFDNYKDSFTRKLRFLQIISQ